MLLPDSKIRRGEIARYLGPEFWSAFRLWKRWRRFGLPHGAGWIHEPACTIDILELFQDESEAYEAERAKELEQQAAAARQSRSHRGRR